MQQKKYKKIPKSFKRNGFDYKIIKRIKDVVLLEQFKDFKSEGVLRQWEVHKVRLNQAGDIKYKQSDGSHIVVKRPDREKLAGNEAFGSYGWHFKEKENAMKKFDELVKNEK